MKVFISSTYIDLIEHRKAAHGEYHPRIREWRVFYSFIRELFVDGLSQSLSTGTQP